MAVIYNYMFKDEHRWLRGTAPEDNDISHYRRFQMTETELTGTDPIQVRLLGYELYHPGKSVHRASQMYIIRYVIGGTGWFNGQLLQRGNVYFTVPRVEYRIESSESDPMVQFWIELTGPGVPEKIMQMLGTVEPSIHSFSFIDEIAEPFTRVFFERSEKIDPSTYMHTALYHLLALHKREMNKNFNPTLSHSLQLFYDATRFIEAHYTEPITIKSICDRLHIVPDYLYKIFRQYTGMSSQQYILNYKMNMAASLLLQSDMPVSQVGSRVGYPDQSQFSRVFRKHNGCSPQDYRKRQK